MKTDILIFIVSFKDFTAVKRVMYEAKIKKIELNKINRVCIVLCYIMSKSGEYAKLISLLHLISNTHNHYLKYTECPNMS